MPNPAVKRDCAKARSPLLLRYAPSGGFSLCCRFKASSISTAYLDVSALELMSAHMLTFLPKSALNANTLPFLAHSHFFGKQHAHHAPTFRVLVYCHATTPLVSKFERFFNRHFQFHCLSSSTPTLNFRSASGPLTFTLGGSICPHPLHRNSLGLLSRNATHPWL